MINDGAGIYDILVMTAEEYKSDESTIHTEALAENLDRLKFQLERLSLMDKVHFAELYTSLLRKSGISISESDFLQESPSKETFVYVKNPYADEAYDVFAEEFDDPRVRYAGSFKEAVGLVDSGEVTYCLLPLEERGARLVTIAELLYRYELKINSVIPVFGIDGSADIKYALVSRGYTVPARDPDDDRYLEIRLSDGEAPTLSELLTVAEAYAGRVYRVNTLAFPNEEGKKEYYSMVFSGEDVDFTTLLVFLTMFAADYTAVGIYKNLDTLFRRDRNGKNRV